MRLTFSKASRLTPDELAEVVFYLVVDWMYNLVGKLLMRRRCYIHACTCRPDIEQHTYFPHDDFIWQREYWKKFRPTCSYCKQVGTSRIIRSFGALVFWGLPGYKAHNQNDFRIYYLLSSPEEQMRQRILVREIQRSVEQ
jgi:hypothetical protein